jgi:5-formyltetrahydrofolate cyclo-ligase
MGGGYYDRTFSEKKSTIYVGLGYSFQFEDQSFEEKHDMKMDYVVTQKGVLK